MSKLFANVAAGVVVVALTSMTALPATADNNPGNTNPPAAQTQTVSENKTPTDKAAPEFAPATVFIHNKGNIETVKVSEADTTVSSIFSSRGLNPLDFRTSQNQAVDPSATIASGDNVVFFDYATTGTVTEITLPREETVEETKDLFIGQTSVKSEGKDGKAIKTVIKSVNNSTNKEVNDKTDAAAPVVVSEEKITVVEKPEPKIVLVGTKELPEVEAAPTAARERATAATTAAATASSRGTSASRAAATPSASATPYNVDSSIPVLEFAYSKVGSAYVWGKSGPNAFDCSGLVYAAWQSKGVNIPRTAATQGAASTPVPLSQLMPGDILWTSGHIGIYIGDNKMIHASTPATGVKVSDIDWFVKQGAKGGRLP